MLVSALFSGGLALAGSKDVFTGCGTYRVQGLIVQDKADVEIRVFRGSQDETRLRLTGKKALDGLAYAGKTTEITGKITAKLNRYRGKIEVLAFAAAVPDPVDPSYGDGFWLKEPESCR